MRAEVLFFAQLGPKAEKKTAAHFDHQSWLKMADHAVSDQGVHAIKEIVIEIKVARFAVGFVGNCSYSSRNFGKSFRSRSSCTESFMSMPTSSLG